MKMKTKIKLKFHLIVFVLILGIFLLISPFNVFAVTDEKAPTEIHSYTEPTKENILNTPDILTGQPQSAWASIISSDIGAMNGVTIDGFGNVTVNAWQMGNFAVGPQPAPNLNIYDAGAWKAFNPGQSLMDAYSGGGRTVGSGRVATIIE